MEGRTAGRMSLQGVNMSLLQELQKLCRTNTGRHFLDSGDHYGRKYEQPIPSEPYSYEINAEDGAIESIHISLAHHLNNVLHKGEISEKLNKLFAEYLETADNSDWGADIDSFMELQGYENKGSDNTYNCDNDLDQNLLYHMYLPKDCYDDMYYSDKVIIAIRPHCGCDIRGGYPQPVLYEFADEPARLVNYSIGFHFPEPDDDQLVLEGFKVEWYKVINQLGLDELSSGYSNYVWNRLPEDCKIYPTDKNGVVTFKWDNGRELEAYVEY
jgi:hypothetical protein